MIRFSFVKPVLIFAGALCAVSLAPPVHADTPAVVDSGSYRVYRQDRPFGTESFAFELRGDSLVISSQVTQLYPAESGQDTLHKQMVMVVRAADYDLLAYDSNQMFRGLNLRRGLSAGDTTLVSVLQVDQRGEGTAVVRPPGRIYVLDPQVFVLYDVICRNLHGQTFDERTIVFYALGVPDTVFQATAADLGTETIRWGARPVQARKLRISDAETQFYVWISPRGQMLRLEQPAYGLRVEREAAPVRPPARRRPRAG